MTSETDAELAENITETADAAERTGGNVYLSVDRQRRLRLEARTEINEATVKRATEAMLRVNEDLTAMPFSKLVEAMARAALEAAQKGETP